MKNLFLIAVSGLLLGSGCKSMFPGSSNSFRQQPPPTFRQQSPPTVVSLLSVIANPATFSDQELGVVGFLRIGKDHSLLFVSEENAKNYLLANAIRVKLPNEVLLRSGDFNSRYVVLFGMFKSMPDDINALTVGWLNNVSRCMTMGVGPVYTFPETVVSDDWEVE